MLKRRRGAPRRDAEIIPPRMVATIVRRAVLAVSSVALATIREPGHAAVDARCAAEVAIPGAYLSVCMRDASRSFDLGTAGEVVIEQGDVGPGSTGAAVWGAGAALADALAAAPDAVAGKSVVELGCGTGLCGIAAARLGARRVLLTDAENEPVLARAARNVASNTRPGAGASVRPLPWGSLIDDELRGSADVVLAAVSARGLERGLLGRAHALPTARPFPRRLTEREPPPPHSHTRQDVLYQSSGWRPLAQTAAELLRPGSGTLLLCEAGHEATPARATVDGFRAVAEGCGLAFWPEEALAGGALLVRARAAG